MMSPKVALGAYSTNNNWSITLWIYMQVEGRLNAMSMFYWHILRLSNLTNGQTQILAIAQKNFGNVISIAFALENDPDRANVRYFQEFKWKKMIIQESEGNVRAFFADEPQNYLQMATPFATEGQKVEEIQLSYTRIGGHRNRQDKIYCKSLHLWKSKSIREQHMDQIDRLQVFIFSILIRDFGTNYPTDYLQDGWKLTPDFDFNTRFNSYSGSLNFQSTPDFNLLDIFTLQWKSNSPLFGLQICDSTTQIKYYDQHSQSCKMCPVDCKICSTGNNCAKCDASKQKINGICLDMNTLIVGAPGQIQSTDFNLSDALTTAHQQLPKMTIDKIIFNYPNQSKQQIIYKNPFKVPRYSQQTNGNPYTVNAQILLINDGNSQALSYQLAGLTQIEPTSIDASNPQAASQAINELEKTIPSSQDIPPDQSLSCNCINGVCQNQKCVCNQGFSGHECKHSEQLRKQIQEKKDEITQNFINNPPADDSQSIKTISDLVEQPTTLTTKSAESLLQKLTSITQTTTKALTSDEVQNVISSGVSIIRASDYNKQEKEEDESKGTALIKKAMKTLQQISNSSFVQPTPGNPFVIEKKKFSLKVQEVDTAQEEVSVEIQNPNSNTDKKSSISFPSTELNAGPGVQIKVSVLVLQENPFLDQKIRFQSVSTPLIDINIFADGKKQLILGKKLQLKFPMTQRMLNLIKQGNPSEFSCQYYDEDEQKWQSNGLQNLGTENQTIQCSTSHLTSFSSFLKKSVSVIKQSNYNVFLEFQKMTWKSLSRNVGFYFIVSYWGLFFILFILMYSIDKKKLKNDFEKIAENEVRKGTQALQAITQTAIGISMPEPGKKKGKSKGKNNIIIKKRKGLERQGSIDSMRNSKGDEDLKKEQNFDKTRNLNSVLIQEQRVETDQNLVSKPKRRVSLKQLSYDEFKSGLYDQKEKANQNLQNGEHKLSDQDNKSTFDGKGVIPVKASKFQKIVYKLENYTQASERGHCCVGFMSTVKGQIASNNIPINVISTTSVLVPRTVRLTIFFLAILLEISMVALFFNLQPEDEADSSFLQDFIENLWIGIYSVLLSAIPLLLVSCLLTYPSKYKEKLESVLETQNFRATFDQLKKRYRKILIAGYVMFFAFMIFLSLFVIAFSEKANYSLSKNWIESSFIGIILDQVALELLAAIAIGLIMVTQRMFRFCKCLIIIAVLIEIYRLYRNLSD